MDSKGDPIRFEAGDANLYGYVVNDPVNLVDSSGLINIVFGAGGSAVGVAGVEGSVGIVVNPGIGEARGDVGVFVSGGAGGGVNVSGDIFVGAVQGDIGNVEGFTANVNTTIGPLSFTIFTDPITGEIIGGTVGIGPGATPIGASGTIAETATLTLEELVDLILERLTDRPCP